MKLECFQLSFDIHIVHTSQKFRFFPNCSTKNGKIFPLRLIDFAAFNNKTKDRALVHERGMCVCRGVVYRVGGWKF